MQIMTTGIILVICSGICWIGIGISVSVCVARSWNYNIVQGLCYFGSALLCLSILFCGDWPEGPSAKMLLLSFLLSCLAGIANFYTYVLTAKAMSLGPHGLVWGMMQAGMIGSFLMGICCFGEKASWLRLTGLGLIIGGVLAMGIGRDNRQRISGKKWLPPSIGAFFLVMVTHCCNTLPSFLPEAAGSGSLFRTFGMYSGGFLGFAVTTLPGLVHRKNIGGRGEWIMAAVLMFLNVAASVFLFYNGLNLLVRNGCGSLGYPVAIGVCVAGFSLFSLFILKEKIAPLSKVGLLAVSAGIITITLR